MKLTEKDGEFLMRLRALLDEKGLSIEFRQSEFAHFVLRKNYGERIDKEFGMTRQGVRWRFNHVFNEIYVNAYTAIVMIESAFGTELRRHALSIAKERAELRERAKKMADIRLPRRQTDRDCAETRQPELTRDSPS